MPPGASGRALNALAGAATLPALSRQSSVPLAARSGLGGAVTTAAERLPRPSTDSQVHLQGRSAAPRRPSPSPKLKAEAGFCPQGPPPTHPTPRTARARGRMGQHVSPPPTEVSPQGGPVGVVVAPSRGRLSPALMSAFPPSGPPAGRTRSSAPLGAITPLTLTSVPWVQAFKQPPSREVDLLGASTRSCATPLTSDTSRPRRSCGSALASACARSPRPR